MFKVGETIKTSTGEAVSILQFLSSIDKISVYKVSIDEDIFIMKWFDKELYEGHFKIIDSLCKEKWSKVFVSPIKMLQIQVEDDHGFGYIVPFVSAE